MKRTVLNNQSLLDIAIQATGKAENYLKIAMANGLVPTEPIAPGTVLTIPDTVDIDEAVVRYYSANAVRPATQLTDEQTEAQELTFWEKVINALNF
jgi:hypothetical protein